MRREGGWEPRTKTVASVLYVFGAVSLNTPLFVLAALGVALAGAMHVRLPWRVLLRKWLLLLPFVLLVALPLLWSGGWPLEESRVELALLIALKAYVSMTVMTAMLATQPSEHFLAGLARLRVPPLIVSMLFLAFRYVHLFTAELKMMQKGLASRLFTGRPGQRALRVYGEVLGGFLVKALDRSDSVYRALASRGFNGSLPHPPPPAISGKDWLRGAAAAAAIAGIIIAERVVM